MSPKAFGEGMIPGVLLNPILIQWRLLGISGDFPLDKFSNHSGLVIATSQELLR
jgi:hypothetical protein